MFLGLVVCLKSFFIVCFPLLMSFKNVFVCNMTEVTLFFLSFTLLSFSTVQDHAPLMHEYELYGLIRRT